MWDKKKKKIEKLKYRVKKLFSSTGCHELEVEIRVFPGGPVVKNLPSDAEYVGSVPDQGTKDSTCCSAAKPGSHNYWILHQEPVCPRDCKPKQIACALQWKISCVTPKTNAAK